MEQLQGVLADKQKTILCLNILVTGRCNASCSYCHFFGMRNKSKVNYDISDELFNIYALFAVKVREFLPSNFEIQCRFSGGEPLVLEDRIFNLAKKMYATAGIAPYVLTNGKEISNNFINSAKESHIKHFYVSLENPLAPDKGAPDPWEIISKIKKYNSDECPIVPGITVVTNNHFKNLYEICQIFYKELRCLPVINEVSFNSFIPPNREQLVELYKNIFKVVKYFRFKTTIKLFPDISPELYFGQYNHHVFPLGINNKYKLSEKNIETKLLSTLNNLNKNYQNFNCKNSNCEWFQDCRRVKWIWKEGFGAITPEEKMKSYCEMKKTINGAFYDALK